MERMPNSYGPFCFTDKHFTADECLKGQTDASFFILIKRDSRIKKNGFIAAA
jgi:hypothetical protein